MFTHLASHHEVQWIGNRHLGFWVRCLIKVQTLYDMQYNYGGSEDLLVKFEADHPRLTSVLQQVLDGLANLGI